ncbi:MAG: pepO [Nevskia sp.]|nr:pepO [Nevskia sp.]
MKPNFFSACIGAALLAACSKPAETPAPTAPAAAPPALLSGIETQYADDSVRIQDDFYKHVNGKWLAATEIPADKPGYGAFTKLYDDAQEQLKTLIEAAAKDGAGDADKQKIGDLYNSFMDEAKLEELGLKPLDADFALIDAVKDKKELAALIGTLGKKLSQPGDFGPNETTLPFVVAVHQDNKDSTKYVADLQQSGIGLPDRDYYLKNDDAKLKTIRDQYLQHVEKMLRLAGDKAAAKNAKDIVALETELAKLQWDKVTLRDPIKAYNKVMLVDLPKLAPGFDWDGFIKAADIAGKTDYVIVGQPSYLSGFGKLLAKTPLPLWKNYFKWHVLNDGASALSNSFVVENFAFKGTALRGVPQDRPRWKRAVALVETAIGEGLGKLYVAQYFPPENKARVEALVNNLLAAYKQGIDTLDWMSADTKKEAQAKLAKIAVKIGYPNQWRDYSKLEVAKDDLFGNIRHANAFEYARTINKLGTPIDRGEWGMTPQTVNAEYNPELNDITFPAAILQPPFFNVKADDAVNYGGIGAVIGHEISHAFDDQGAQYDGDGNLRDWWTKDDHAKFAAKTKALVAEYDAFVPLAGYHVNGALTLGENIADNSGLAIAYKAYQIDLGGKEAPSLDGFSGIQRFYMGFAQVWREKLRDNFAIELIKTDPHSPPEFRGNGTVVNQPGFYSAFDIKQGDKMYLPPERRVGIW